MDTGSPVSVLKFVMSAVGMRVGISLPVGKMYG